MKYLLLLFFTFAFVPPTKRVYVCQSPTAYAYHYYKADKCEGLAKCRNTITETSLDSAFNVFGKAKLCSYCKNIENK